MVPKVRGSLEPDPRGSLCVVMDAATSVPRTRSVTRTLWVVPHRSTPTNTAGLGSGWKLQDRRAGRPVDGAGELFLGQPAALANPVQTQNEVPDPPGIRYCRHSERDGTVGHGMPNRIYENAGRRPSSDLASLRPIARRKLSEQGIDRRTVRLQNPAALGERRRRKRDVPDQSAGTPRRRGGRTAEIRFTCGQAVQRRREGQSNAAVRALPTVR